MTSSIDLDTKALEAAADAMAEALLSDMGLVPVEIAANVIQSYLSALPKPSEEVAGMVKRLRAEAQRRLDWRTYCNQAPTAHDEEETFLLKTATLLEALDLALRLRERDDPDAGIRGWNFLHDLVAQAREYLALPPAADDDVAEMVGWLQDAATHEDDKDQRTGLRRGAAMLEALSQSREADRVRARNEGIEMAAKCIEAKHAHNIGGVVHPIAQSDAAAIRALKDRL